MRIGAVFFNPTFLFFVLGLSAYFPRVAAVNVEHSLATSVLWGYCRIYLYHAATEQIMMWLILNTTELYNVQQTTRDWEMNVTLE